MRAQLGDHIVIESPATGATRRDGEIVGLHHADGTPPYDVRWSDTDDVTLVFPGRDAHVRHVEHGPGSDGTHAPSQPGLGEAGAASDRTAPLGPPNPGDIGRRVAAERERQGMSRTEAARRARMAPGTRVKLTSMASPAVERPEVAQADPDIDGRPARVHVAGTVTEAVDLLAEQLGRLAQVRLPHPRVTR